MIGENGEYFISLMIYTVIQISFSIAKKKIRFYRLLGKKERQC